MEPIKSPVPPQTPSKNLSTYLGIIVLTIVIIALGAVAVSSVLNSDDTPEELTTDETSRAGDTSMPSDLPADTSDPLDQSPFDPSNPNIDGQIKAIEAELGGMETDLLEEELSDEQLGIE